MLTMDEIAALNDLKASLRDLRDSLARAGNSNRSTISINAGGIGVWVATTACAVMLACNVFLAALVIEHSRRLDRLEDYLSAIYMQAPHLKPQEKKQ